MFSGARWARGPGDLRGRIECSMAGRSRIQELAVRLSADSELAVEIRTPGRARAKWTRRASGSAQLVSPSTSGARHFASPTKYLRDAVRRRRGRPGRLRQGLLAYHVLPRSVAVRGLVYAHSHQRVPRSAQGARPARSLVRLARFRPDLEDRRSTRRASLVDAGPGDANPEHRLLARERRAAHRRGRSIASTAGSGPSSCCATMEIARHGKSAR